MLIRRTQWGIMIRSFPWRYLRQYSMFWKRNLRRLSFTTCRWGNTRNYLVGQLMLYQGIVYQNISDDVIQVYRSWRIVGTSDCIDPQQGCLPAWIYGDISLIQLRSTCLPPSHLTNIGCHNCRREAHDCWSHVAARQRQEKKRIEKALLG